MKKTVHSTLMSLIALVIFLAPGRTANANYTTRIINETDVFWRCTIDINNPPFFIFTSKSRYVDEQIIEAKSSRDFDLNLYCQLSVYCYCKGSVSVLEFDAN